MFAFSTPDLTDNIQPFFVRSESTPRPDDITLATFVPQDSLSELIRLVDHFPGRDRDYTRSWRRMGLVAPKKKARIASSFLTLFYLFPPMLISCGFVF